MTVKVSVRILCAFCGHELVDCEKVGFIEEHTFVHPCINCFPKAEDGHGNYKRGQKWPTEEAIEEAKRRELHS